MPLAQFICPDKVNVELANCLEHCRMPQRCLTRTTLKVIAGDRRAWDGIPHVTQLLNGTMLEFLRITKDYTIDPRDMAFALLGSSHHKLLESGSDAHPAAALEKQGMVSELVLDVDWIQGTLDLLEVDNEELVLTDFKTWGSGKLAHGDYTEVTMQLNMYRVMVKEQFGWDVDRMQVQCTVRDGGLAVTKKRGITSNMVLIPIPVWDDALVTQYFRSKAKVLGQALESGVQPQPCTEMENWNFVRCRSYCEVAQHCLGVKI